MRTNLANAYEQTKQYDKAIEELQGRHQAEGRECLGPLQPGLCSDAAGED